MMRLVNGPIASPRLKLSVVFTYYDNPEMLTYQLQHFSRFSSDLLAQIEILVVDDASPRVGAASVACSFPGLPLSIFRIDHDKPWNQDAARNIGAHEAHASSLLLTDIDHVVPTATLQALLTLCVPEKVFSLGRKAHFSDKIVPSHVNSYFLSRGNYWDIGGYDEDFWGTYGSDWFFRQRINRRGGVVELADARLELVTQGSIPDAKTLLTGRTPSVSRKLRAWVLRFAKRFKILEGPRVLSNTYTRTY